MSNAQSKSKFAKFQSAGVFKGQPSLSKGNAEIEALKKKVNTASSGTAEAVEKLLNSPTPENMEAATQEIKNDPLLPEVEKTVVLAQLYEIDEIKNLFLKRFNFENCPKDYEILKNEVKFLAGINQYSFLLMAQRLLKIRDGELYRPEYNDFKTFIEEELPLAKRSAYNYINILECFGVQPVALENDIEYTKLLPAVPLLKSKKENIPKDEIKKHFIAVLKEKSKREMEEEAKQLKIKYGISMVVNNMNYDLDIERFMIKVKSNPDKFSKDKIKELIRQLNCLVN